MTQAIHDKETRSKIKAFYHLLVNSSLAAVLNYTVWFAITFFVYIQTQSVFATTIIFGAFLVAVAFTGIWFGSIVDNYRKKQVMIWSSCASLAAYIFAFGVYMAFPESAYKEVTSAPLWILVLTTMAGVVAGSLRSIALPTIVTMLIPEADRDKANGLSGTAIGLSMLVTSVISGILVGIAGMLYVFILAIGGFLGIVTYLMIIPVPEPKILRKPDAPRKVDLKGTLAVIGKIPGLYALILFTTLNNFLGGVFMSLMDPYGLSLVSVQVWGILWGFLSCGFIVGGILIAKKGLGRNPLKAMLVANIIIWTVSCLFAIQPSIILLTIGMFIYMAVTPYIEAAEQTVLQKVVPPERQGRVFGFAQSVEQVASPLTAFMIGPVAQFIAIPFMTTGTGTRLVGSWFGTGANRGIALVFIITGLIGLCVTIFALSSSSYRRLSKTYLEHPEVVKPRSS